MAAGCARSRHLRQRLQSGRMLDGVLAYRGLLDMRSDRMGKGAASLSIRRQLQQFSRTKGSCQAFTQQLDLDVASGMQMREGLQAGHLPHPSVSSDHGEDKRGRSVPVSRSLGLRCR